jgi:hypothetical protein
VADDQVSETGSDLAFELDRLRDENAALKEQLEAPVESTKAPGRGRRWGSIICAVVGAIILPLAVITVWTRNTILDTDQYVETVAPLAENEDIQEAISFRVTEAIAEAADFRKLAEDTLPPEAAILAGPIESGARNLIQQVVDELLSTDAFARVWEDVNRIGHQSLVNVLTGDGNDVVETDGGRVVLQLGPFAQEVVKELDDLLGTEFADSIPTDRLDAEFVIVESDDLADVQGALQLLDAMSWITVILAIGFLLAAVLLAEKRRLGFRRLGIALVVPAVITLLLYSWSRGQYVGALPSDVHNPDAATAFFDIMTRFIPQALRAILVLGVIVLLGAWVTGPSRWAAEVRSWWDSLLGRAGDASGDGEAGAIPQWVAAHQRPLYIATVVLGILALVLWTRPTGLVVVFLAIVFLLIIGGIRLIAEVGKRTAEPIAGNDAVDDDDAVESGDEDDRDTEEVGSRTGP